MRKVMWVRIYVRERGGSAEAVMRLLKGRGVIGATVLRAVAGFGRRGDVGLSLVDVSLDRPEVIDFFDTEERVRSLLTDLKRYVSADHILITEAWVPVDD